MTHLGLVFIFLKYGLDDENSILKGAAFNGPSRIVLSVVNGILAHFQEIVNFTVITMVSNIKTN
jgi:hypothetical protein